MKIKMIEKPSMVDMDHLFNVVNDDEDEILTRILVRAGYLWVCDECGWREPTSEAICGGCDRPNTELLSLVGRG